MILIVAQYKTGVGKRKYFFELRVISEELGRSTSSSGECRGSKSLLNKFSFKTIWISGIRIPMNLGLFGEPKGSSCVSLIF